MAELVTSRWLPAPPERVFDAFADPAQLARWWGPRGFTTTTLAFDLRAGGVWRLVMRGPDGADYPMAKQVVRVERPRLVVLRHDQAGHGFDHVMEWEPERGGTRLTWRMRFAVAAELEAVAAAMRQGNEENLDRLAEHLGRSGADAAIA